MIHVACLARMWVSTHLPGADWICCCSLDADGAAGAAPRRRSQHLPGLGSAAWTRSCCGPAAADVNSSSGGSRPLHGACVAAATHSPRRHGPCAAAAIAAAEALWVAIRAVRCCAFQVPGLLLPCRLPCAGVVLWPLKGAVAAGWCLVSTPWHGVTTINRCRGGSGGSSPDTLGCRRWPGHARLHHLQPCRHAGQKHAWYSCGKLVSEGISWAYGVAQRRQLAVVFGGQACSRMIMPTVRACRQRPAGPHAPASTPLSLPPGVPASMRALGALRTELPGPRPCPGCCCRCCPWSCCRCQTGTVEAAAAAAAAAAAPCSAGGLATQRLTWLPCIAYSPSVAALPSPHSEPVTPAAAWPPLPPRAEDHAGP